jgi:hypothetical protein
MERPKTLGDSSITSRSSHMLQRIALLVGGLAAAATLATAMLLSRIGGPAAQAAPVNPASAQPTVQVDTVYIPPPAPQQTVTIQGSAQGEGEGGDDGAGDH